ncbi:hypothetical protein POM88_007721 [Heracleum sosnowskyi]|uniref:RRM domain-containing protein n=1 Tax=Heracleum sosnowskyi TaxID=360622 RepID=A0AAD8J7C5_9APIA|nr:hypothetical protein POM88_007721 [Heracleum sosnowskyi]
MGEGGDRCSVELTMMLLRRNCVKYLVTYLTITEDVLRERFSEYGNISTVVVMKDSAGVSYFQLKSYYLAKIMDNRPTNNYLMFGFNSMVLQKLSSMQRLVVSTGGGAVIRPINWRHMQKGFSVWLDVPVEALARRITSVGTESRPLLHNKSGDAYAKE